MNRSQNKIHAEEVCNFLKHIGYPDASIVDAYGCDIEVTSLGEKVQIFDGGWDQDQNIHLFLGYERDDGLHWRLLDCNSVILVVPDRFHIVPSRSLLETILANKWHCTNRVPSRKNKEVLLIKVRSPFLVHGISDLRTFSRETFEEIKRDEDPNFEF